MDTRVEKFAQHREALKKNHAIKQNFINDHVDRYLQKLKPIFDETFVNKIEKLRSTFDLKKFSIDYNVFSSYYSLPLEYKVENLADSISEQIKHPTTIKENLVKYQVNFHDEKFLQNSDQKAMFNYPKNKNYLKEIWDTFQAYKTANIVADNDSMPTSNLKSVSTAEFLNANDHYNVSIKKIKQDFSEGNVKLLHNIRKFKIRGRILYIIIPCTLLLTALCLGFALLLQ